MILYVFVTLERSIFFFVHKIKLKMITQKITQIITFFVSYRISNLLWKNKKKVLIYVISGFKKNKNNKNIII